MRYALRVFLKYATVVFYDTWMGMFRQKFKDCGFGAELVGHEGCAWTSVGVCELGSFEVVV